MDISQRHYYRLNIRLLKSIGLWPYQERNVRLFRASIVNGVVTLFSCVMIFQIIISNGNEDIVIDAITLLMAAIDVYAKYHTYYLSLHNVKTLLNNMIVDWKMWTTKEEVEIMKKYAKEGRLYTLSYTIYLYFASFIFVSLSLVPVLLDKIIPLNESRVLNLPVPGYYYVDQDEHFYLLYYPMSSMIMLGMTVIIAVDTQFFVFVCHLCGVFSVVGFRLERLLRDDTTKDVLSSNRYEDCYQYLALSIRGHKRAMEFASIIESSFSYPLLIQCAMNVGCLSISLYRITVLMSISTEIFRYITFVAGQLFHIFFTAYFGQRIIDHSSQVFYQAYNGPWYEAPIKIRKLLLFVMRRSLDPIKLTAGKIFIFSMEGFLTIVQTSTSYFMVLLSVQ